MGTIAGQMFGINYEEELGSPNIDTDISGITAKRIIYINWYEVWVFITAAFNVYSVNDPFNIIHADRSFSGFPGNIKVQNTFNIYCSDLVLSGIQVTPKHDGRQADVSTDTNNGGIATYGKARLVLTYESYTHPRYLTDWSMTTVKQNIVGTGYTFASGDLVPPLSKRFPSQEIVTLVRTQELTGATGDFGIQNLSTAEAAVGKINSTAINLYSGNQVKTMAAKTLLFVNWEVEPTYYFGRAGLDIRYRFHTSPGATWETAFDSVTNTFLPITGPAGATVYGTYNFNSLFPFHYRTTP